MSIDPMEVIRTLCALPPRLPCSEGERLGHEHVAQVLRSLGLAPVVEEFPFVQNGYAALALHTGALAAAGLVGLAIPVVGAGLASLATASLYGDFQSRWFWLRRLLPTGMSRNVVARVPSSGPVRRRVVIMAHVDVAREGPPAVYAPARAKAVAHFCHTHLGSAPGATQAIFWGGALETALLGAAAAGLPGRSLAAVLAAVEAWVSAQMALAARSPGVPGAADNASGVAILLALGERLCAEPLAGTEVWLAATGCEEAMLGGALDLLGRHAGELPAASTWFLALDTLGAGQLHYATGEGLAASVRHDPGFVALAAAAAEEDPARPQPYAMTFCTDALVPAVRGYRALSLIALDEDGYPANYHWRTDVPEAIDPAVLAAARDYTLRLLRRIDASEAA